MREGNESKRRWLVPAVAHRAVSASAGRGAVPPVRGRTTDRSTGWQLYRRFSVDGGAMTYRVHTDTEDTRSAVGCSASLVCQTHCTEEQG